jgi:hypothetical protein
VCVCVLGWAERIARQDFRERGTKRPSGARLRGEKREAASRVRKGPMLRKVGRERRALQLRGAYSLPRGNDLPPARNVIHDPTRGCVGVRPDTFYRWIRLAVVVWIKIRERRDGRFFGTSGAFAR